MIDETANAFRLAIAWAAYSRAWPEAMAGVPEYSFGGCEQPVITYQPPAPLDWSDDAA